jgi:hypothetical protein
MVSRETLPIYPEKNMKYTARKNSSAFNVQTGSIYTGCPKKYTI